MNFYGTLSLHTNISSKYRDRGTIKKYVKFNLIVLNSIGMIERKIFIEIEEINYIIKVYIYLLEIKILKDFFS